GRHHQRQDGRHARGRCHAGLGPFQRRQTLLHGGYRRVAEARVDIARLLPGEARGGLRGAVEHEARGQVERLAVLVELAARRARADRLGVEVELVHRPAGQWSLLVTRFRSSWPSSWSSCCALAGLASPRWFSTPFRYSAVMSPVTYWPSEQEVSKKLIAGFTARTAAFRSSRSW